MFHSACFLVAVVISSTWGMSIRNESVSMYAAVNIWKDMGSKAAYCGVSAQHTACLYTNQNQLGKCGSQGIIDRVVDAAGIKTLLDTHNKRRSEVAKGLKSPQPGASNMVKLTWNAEAAAIAQLWLDQCVWGHDKSRQTVKPRPLYNGQNAYMSYSSSPSYKVNYAEAVNAWFDEIKDYPPSAVDRLQFSAATGHYTQVVWAETTQVGCGFVRFKGTNGWYTNMVTCNYAPGGNMGGSALYKRGNACSACPTGYSKCEDGLCTK
jgi:hypothetical protein